MRKPGGDKPEKRGEIAQPSFALASLWRYLKWQGSELSPDERRNVLSQLFFEGDRRLPYLYRFGTLLSLSVAIASFGLLTDSTAVVIGAMLVAPLMTPIQATAASLVMGWEGRQLRSLLLVGIAAVGCVGLAYCFGLTAPDRVTLPDEIMSRTSPTLLDLGIALAAGAAGAYTIVRRESSAIPGVAVAVALVPPLAVVGLTLENGRPDLALGALLLFSTNLVAIVLAASLVLLITGFAPRALIERNWHLIRRGVIFSAVSVLIVSVPLAIHSKRVIEDARDQHAIEHAIDTWLESNDDFDVNAVSIDGHEVKVDIVGPHEPTNTILLNQLIIDRLGSDATVKLRWIQRQEAVLR